MPCSVFFFFTCLQWTLLPLLECTGIVSVEQKSWLSASICVICFLSSMCKSHCFLKQLSLTGTSCAMNSPKWLHRIFLSTFVMLLPPAESAENSTADSLLVGSVMFGLAHLVSISVGVLRLGQRVGESQGQTGHKDSNSFASHWIFLTGRRLLNLWQSFTVPL